MKKTERQASRPTGSPKTVKTGERKPGVERSIESSAKTLVVENQPGEKLSLVEIKELIELISEKQFNEFELERGDFRLRLQRGASRGQESAAVPVVVAAAPAPASTAAGSLAVPTPVAEASTEEKLHVVTSPIVGTFYRSPSPTSESFVKIGDTVEVGKTLCIIEAMKLMNEIQSDAMGTIAKIYAENGQPVEYGQPLFGLKV
jgi:acetyl-CoA carboxylase biotin carboxyl carrier protein